MFDKLSLDLTITTSDLVAISALGLSIFILWITHRFNERQKEMIDSQTKINQRALEQHGQDAVASQKADVGADFLKLGSNKYRLKVFNKGPASARNVRMTIVSNNSPINQGDLERKFPLESLKCHQSAELIASPHFQSPPKTIITLSWDDDYAVDRHETVHLTL